MFVLQNLASLVSSYVDSINIPFYMWYSLVYAVLSHMYYMYWQCGILLRAHIYCIKLLENNVPGLFSKVQGIRSWYDKSGSPYSGKVFHR